MDANGVVNLERLRAERNYRGLIEFNEVNGLFVLESYYEAGWISRQTFLDMAALFDALDLICKPEDGPESREAALLFVAGRHSSK